MKYWTRRPCAPVTADLLNLGEQHVDCLARAECGVSTPRRSGTRPDCSAKCSLYRRPGSLQCRLAAPAHDSRLSDDLEARVGFEPTNGGFADLSLGPLGYRAW